MTEELDRIVKYNSLLNTYGELLSDTQKEILTDYFGYNLSISEIAESRNVSRAAVEDAIKKGEKKLDEYENKLGFCAKNLKISTLLEELKNQNLSIESKKIVEDIERTIK